MVSVIFLCWQLVQERFPVGWHPSCGSRCGLTFGMRVRRKQLHTLARDHALLLVIVKPILTRLEAGNDRMSCRCRMLGCMLTWRTITASDVPTLGTPTEMKPPTFRRCKAFHTSVATWFRSEIKSALILLHFDFSIRRCMSNEALRLLLAPTEAQIRFLFESLWKEGTRPDHPL